tara:strand:+ start:109 stop:948 length:840 start_codon:yes stop_codon:yes gene_type:complete
MKKFLISFLLATLIMIPTEIFAADYETPHEFSAGDTISADMLNELFNNIKLSKTAILSSDLVGTWSCKVSIRYSSSHATGWTADSDSLYQKLTSTITFIADGDGTYSYESTAPNPFFAYDDRAISGHKYAVLSNSFYFTFPRKDQNGTIATDDKAIYYLSKTSKNSYLFIRGGATDISPDSLICDKQNLPPSMPSTFTASVSGKTVSLAWTDSSTDETGFKVLRKDSLTGSYSTVTTTSADATSYSDTVTAAGSYWYRVSATNSNGDSVASKMVKVDVE